MAEQTIDYETLHQDALRGVVKTVLGKVAEDGLGGSHHFYVAFNTQAEGVGLSKRLREQYPEEMTIVLQHRFWDLLVYDDRFEVKLTFNSIPERLIIPFKALKVFFDPSVPFGLQFDTTPGTPEQPRRTPSLSGIAQAPEEAMPPRIEPERPVQLPRAPRRDDTARPAKPAEPVTGPRPLRPIAEPVATGGPPESPSSGEADGDGGKGKSADVVSLDAFRKK
jgi:hypothetical protein